MSQATRNCPHCNSARRSRQHRGTLADKVWSLTGLYPYLCLDCEKPFRSRRSAKGVPVAKGPKWAAKRRGEWVTCPRCAEENSRRIGSMDVPANWKNFLWRYLGIPGYRCPDCRMRFHSIRKPKPY